MAFSSNVVYAQAVNNEAIKKEYLDFAARLAHLEEQEKKYTDRTEDLQKIENLIEQKKQEYANVLDAHTNLGASAHTAQEEIARLLDKKNLAHDNLTKTTKEISEKQFTIVGLNKTKDEISEQIIVSSKKLDNLTATLNQTEKSISEAQQNLLTIQEQKKTAQNELEELANKIVAVKAEILAQENYKKEILSEVGKLQTVKHDVAQETEFLVRQKEIILAETKEKTDEMLRQATDVVIEKNQKLAEREGSITIAEAGIEIKKNYLKEKKALLEQTYGRKINIII